MSQGRRRGISLLVTQLKVTYLKHKIALSIVYIMTLEGKSHIEKQMFKLSQREI